MNKVKFFALALTIGLFAISCGDDDSTAPEVTITSPSNNTTYSVSDTIIFQGTVTDETELATISITSDLGIDETITNFDTDTSHVLNYNITLDSMTAAGAYSLNVNASDADGNARLESVQINIQ